MKVAAFIIPKPNADVEALSVAAVKEFLKERISHFKIPTVVHIVDAFLLLPRARLGERLKRSTLATEKLTRTHVTQTYTYTHTF